MIGLIIDHGVPLECCGQEMTELIPNTVEASAEKHIPAVTVSGNSIEVQVGSVEHPMTEEHFIAFVYLETECGGQRKILKAGDTPKVTFLIADDKPLSVFAYCNLHGLWKAEI